MNIRDIVGIGSNLIALLIASIGLLYQIYQGRRERAVKKVSYIVCNVLPKGPTTHEVDIRLTNSGNVSIERGDYERPFGFYFGESAEIQDARVLEESPPDLGVEVKISSPSTVELTPVLFNSGDSLSLRVGVKGFQQVQPRGRVSDLSQIEEIRAPAQGMAVHSVRQRFLALAFLLVRWPRAFFAILPRRGGLIGAFLFGLLCYETAITLSMLFGSSGASDALSGQVVIVAPALVSVTALETPGVAGVQAGEVSYTVALALVPVAILFRAGIYHLFVRVFVGARNSGFEATFRVFCYSLVGSLVAWIPYIGILGAIWMIYLLYVGIREMHTASRDKAALAV
jgi:hypothetical protein